MSNLFTLSALAWCIIFIWDIATFPFAVEAENRRRAIARQNQELPRVLYWISGPGIDGVGVYFLTPEEAAAQAQSGWNVASVSKGEAMRLPTARITKALPGNRTSANRMTRATATRRCR